MDKRTTGKPTTYELLTASALTALGTTLGTLLGTLIGTTTLVGLHHRYRKQQQPDARLQDYLTGLRKVPSAINFQLHDLSRSEHLDRLKYVCQQAVQAYQSYPNGGHSNKSYPSYDNDKTDPDEATAKLALHTTTMLAGSVCWVSGVASMPQAAATTDDSDNGFGVVGIDADRQIVWQTTMPERVHDIVVQPDVEDTSDQVSNGNKKAACRDVVVMGRRPSEGFWVLDTATGQVKHAIKSAVDRHFYGHACYSLDGQLLYVTENDTVSLAGKIGIYDASCDYQKVAEFDSHGIGPHELIMHPDGETLIIANGGIKTERASREELNLDTMHPSLVYINRQDGQLVEQVFPEHNQMSVRHLAVHNDGTVMVGIQFQGEKHINVPLVLTHKRGDSEFSPLIMPDNQWQRFHQYIASVVVDSQHNLLCVTTPFGGCAAVYDLSTRKLISDVNLPDCAGASVLRSSESYNVQANHNKANRNKNSDPKNTDFKANNLKMNDFDFGNIETDENIDSGKQAGFIISDGLGQLTALQVTGSNAIGLNAIGLKTAAVDSEQQSNQRVTKDSKLHMMSFDNHLQAL
ncbi:hypothetical protein H4W00_000877 [Psychrobacter sp. PL19]|uniref:DUF1513 domain-containing protein n=1 Tax=Psychrobacter sp. PL19 TaxID=2760711 RepID=UPI001AE73A46